MATESNRSLFCWEPEASCSSCVQTLDNHPEDITIIFGEVERMLLGVSAILFAVIGTVANAILLSGLLFAPRELHSFHGTLSTTHFICSVVASDLLFSLLLLPTQASRFLRGDWASGLGSESGFLCQGYPVILYTLTGATILSLMCVTLNKAAFLFGGSKIRQINLQWVTFLVVACCWLLPFIALLPSLNQTYGRVVLKEYTQTCTIVGTHYPEKGEDPKKLLFHIFFFPALIILIVSNLAMCIKVKLMLRDLNNTQKAENVFIGMLGVTFLFWLLYTAPFILVDTLLDSCFQKTGLHAAAYILNWTKVVANPAIFVSYNPHFLTAVRLLPYNALPCLFQLDQEKKRTYADLEMEEHGEQQANNPPRSLSRKESHALSTISTQSSCCCLPR